MSRRLQQNQEPDNIVQTYHKQQSPEPETIQGLEELDQLLDSIDSDSNHSFEGMFSLHHIIQDKYDMRSMHT